MREIKSLDLKDFFFLSILVVLGLAMIQLFLPFLSIIVLAMVIVQLFHPVYRQLLEWTKSRALSSALSTLFALVVVVIPVIVIILLTISEISSLTNSGNLLQNLRGIETFIFSLIDSMNNLLRSIGIPAQNQIAYPDLSQLASTVLNGIKDSLLPITTSIISVSLGALFSGFLLIVSLLYLFSSYDDLPIGLSRLSPLDNKLDNLLFAKFTETTRAVIKGNFLIAIAQATSVSLVMVLMGVGAPVLLWVVMVLLSLVPVGSGLVWFPAGVAMILSGNVFGGIFLIVYSAIIINVVDALLRPYLLKNSIQLHPLVILFSVLGGLTLFGPLGILYGPIIAVFFTSMMDIYTSHFGTKQLPVNEQVSV